MSTPSPKAPGAADYVAVVGCALVPVLALAWGFSDNPYGYYLFLRVVVFFGAIVFAALSSAYNRENLMLVFGAMALLYNPFFRVHLTRDAWMFFNIATIALFVYGLVFWLAAARKLRDAA